MVISKSINFGIINLLSKEILFSLRHRVIFLWLHLAVIFTHKQSLLPMLCTFSHEMFPFQHTPIKTIADPSFDTAVSLDFLTIVSIQVGTDHHIRKKQNKKTKVPIQPNSGISAEIMYNLMPLLRLLYDLETHLSEVDNEKYVFY